MGINFFVREFATYALSASRRRWLATSGVYPLSANVFGTEMVLIEIARSWNNLYATTTKKTRSNTLSTPPNITQEFVKTPFVNLNKAPRNPTGDANRRDISLGFGSILIACGLASDDATSARPPVAAESKVTAGLLVNSIPACSLSYPSRHPPNTVSSKGHAPSQ
jgi:hypothetical protein